MSTAHDRISFPDALDSSSYPYDEVHRSLAGAPGDTETPSSIDYSVLSVAVMTLGLIIVVEVGKHRLEHAAVGKPFFKAVLYGVYGELSTLGVVEFFIWLLHSYYDGLNVAKELVFAKVHFTLFYTAIFNAFQSVILAVIVRRISQQLWVQTESLQLSHYVEIREEFDRVTKQQEELQKSSWVGKHVWWWNPHHAALRQRYNELLLQIRFHELRVHFLEAYQLPLRMKVSDYLIRSENYVLTKLVSVSTTAWLMLTASINLLYYLLGVIATEQRDPTVVGDALIVIFFVALSCFCLAAVVVFDKMKRIFAEIMHTPQLWKLQSDTAQQDEEHVEELTQKQLSLFWGSDPKLVISAIQFMQFGYAVALAVVIIFWDNIQDGPVPMETYIFVIFVFYGLFVIVTAKTIPRYTLCTSLGQLVDGQRLQEALAEFQLEEEKQKRLEEIEFRKYRQYNDTTVKDDQQSMGPNSSIAGGSSTAATSYETPQATNGSVSASIARSDSRPFTKKTSKLSLSANRATLMADLVKLDTSSLRQNLPDDERGVLAEREARRDLRRNRQKSVSDGVALMAKLSSTIDAPVIYRSRKESFRITHDRIPLTVQDDTCIPTRSSGSGESLSTPSNDRDFFSLESDKNVSTGPSQRHRTRGRGRLKAMSDGVAAMASMTAMKRETERSKNPWYASPSGSVKSGNTGEGSGLISPLHPIEEGPNGEFTYHEEIDDDCDGLSIQSNISEGEASDMSSIPEYDKSLMATRLHEIAELSFNYQERALKYFMSQRYHVLSNIFGTMVAFYYIGQRVERFLNTDGIISPNTFIGFDFEESYTFWLLAWWLLMFLLTDIALLLTLGAYENLLRTKERKVYVAAILDMVIVAGCLCCLFVAEVQRCCTRNFVDLQERLLSELGDDTSQRLPAPCDCPAFGGRTFGGLGNVEPYVSLMTLRLFRFFVAKRIVLFLRRKQAENDAGISLHGHVPVLDSDRPFQSEHPLCTVDHVEESVGHHSIKTGTAVELWQDAVARHPSIAAKYGAFSSEMLQIMLGIPIIDKEPLGDAENVAFGDDNGMGDLFSIETQYNNLSTEAQEIIMQGKLGKRVRRIVEPDQLDTSLICEHSIARRLPTSHPKFQVIESPIVTLNDTNVLTSPSARLVRSMRRCDRRLLPILENWSVVDVVMTRFEIIYLEATQIEDGSARPIDAVPTHDALKATKGGKGLRACDVVAGRRVVGQIQLADIASLFVERVLPASLGDDSEPGEELPKNEYWHSSSTRDHEPRKSRWLRIKQDRLKIETIHGHTLFLRFYSDLDDCEKHRERINAEDNGNESLHKNLAFQWAQTIGRLCGPIQLRQELPHFGGQDIDEIRDYLVVHSCANASVQQHRGFRRMSVARNTTRVDTTGPSTMDIGTQDLGEASGGATQSQSTGYRRPADLVVHGNQRLFAHQEVNNFSSASDEEQGPVPT